ncbi:MAG: YqgE/AlgH family protein [Mariprofundaceae bacterium]
MMMQSLSGQLLLATPSLQDRQFKDSVILVCHHDEEGCMGLIINRPQEISVGSVLDDLDLKTEPSFLSHLIEYCNCSYEGGPIDPFRGFVLHDGWHVYDSTMQITPELHLTTSRDILEEVALSQGPEHFMLILGYAGWDAGQLEQELAENAWLITSANHQTLFQTAPEHRWALSAQNIGVNKAHLSSQIGHA